MSNKVIIPYLIIFVFSGLFISAQKKPEILIGKWKLKEYYSPLDMKAKSGNDPCADFLTITLKKKGKMLYTFYSLNDSIIFRGSYTFSKGKFKFYNKIRETLDLGPMQNCISPTLRMDFRIIFKEVQDFEIIDNNLKFIFNDPKTKIRKEIIFEKI